MVSGPYEASKAPPHPDEEARLAVLESLDVLDSDAESEFDSLVRAASLSFSAKTATISLVDHDRQWFKARTGLDLSETPRDISFCTHAILHQNEVMVVPDASQDDRFRDNPLVTQEDGIRFYAGAPIIVEGYPIGTLCIFDPNPRPEGFSKREAAALEEMANVASKALTARVIRRRSERADMERRIEDARIRIALETAQMTVWTWNVPSGRITNFGKKADEAVLSATTEDFEANVLEEDLEKMRKVIAESLKEGDTYRCDFRAKHDPGRWHTVIGTVISRDQNDVPIVMTGIQFDSTEEHQKIEISDMQAQEMRHRVNNLIGLVDALAGRTAREATELSDFVSLFRSRLQALASTQRMLLNSEGTAPLADVIEAVIEPFRKRDQSVISVEVPDLQITGNVSQVVTLVVHELTTNALKYGALRWPYGNVEARGETSDGQLTLVWREFLNSQTGDEPVEDYVEKASTGAGQGIVNRMVTAHGGEISFDMEENGLVARMVIPI